MVSLFDTGPFAPCPAPFNMAAHVLRHAARLGDKPALEILGGDVWSYAQLRTRVARCAAGLVGCGLDAGARVLFRLGNSSDFPVAYLACIWAGLVPVPVSAALTRSEITEIARQTKPSLILWDGTASLPEASTCPVLDTLPQAPEMAPVLGDPNRLAYIVFTSGTSGRPRGVRHAHRAIWARQMMWDGWYGLRESDRVLHAGAFNWTYTLGTGLMDPWSIGATALIPSQSAKTDQLGTLCATHHASIFAAAPGVYRQMLKSPLPQMPNLRHGLSAGEALPPRLREQWRTETDTDLHEALGMSECSTFISGSPSDPANTGTSGKPQQGRRVAVLTDGQIAPYDTPGLLAISRHDPGLMLGYLDAPPLDGEWFTTGDTVSMSKSGAITYLGRDDDMMNAGGYRVSPLEVEAAFSSLEGLVESAATSVEIKQDTQVIALFYTASGPLTEDRLRAHAHSLLAKYKQPRLYIHRQSLPKGGNGKLNRRLLRDSFKAEPI